MASAQAQGFGGTLSWTPPTTNADGSSLIDLVGYKVYYGNESRNYFEVIPINNAGITAYTLDNLAAGTYFISVSALDQAGNESELSEEIVVEFSESDEPVVTQNPGSVVTDSSGGNTQTANAVTGSGGSALGLVELLLMAFALIAGVRRRSALN